MPERLCGVVFVVLPVVTYMLDGIGFKGSVKSKWRNEVVTKKLSIEIQFDLNVVKMLHMWIERNKIK